MPSSGRVPNTRAVTDAHRSLRPSPALGRWGGAGRRAARPVRMATLGKQNPKCWRGCGDAGARALSGSVGWRSCCAARPAVPQRVKSRTAARCAIPPTGIFTKEVKAGRRRDIRTPRVAAARSRGRKVEASQASIDRGRRKCAWPRLPREGRADTGCGRVGPWGPEAREGSQS